jgi:hypothetical protein
MNVEIGTEAPQFPEKEYINGIFVAQCTILDDVALSSLDKSNTGNDMNSCLAKRYYALLSEKLPHGNRKWFFPSVPIVVTICITASGSKSHQLL